MKHFSVYTIYQEIKMKEILEIAETYGISLSESDLAIANEKWGSDSQIILGSGRLY